MTRMRRLVPLLVAVLLCPALSSAQQFAIPTLTRYATDLTGTLSPAELGQLESLLSSFDRSTSTQILVLMVPSIGDESLEDVTLRVAESNKIGTKGKDNGALLFIAKNDKKVRIQVGYGLEGALPDALAGQIVWHEIAPHFREGDYYSGIRAGVESIIAATRNEYKAEPALTRPGGGISKIVLLIIIAFYVLFFRRRFRRAGFFGGGPWMFGGWGSGGGGSSSFGGGGFSGGGGSFGGGGASGSW